MKKTADQSYECNGTRFHFRVFEDLWGTEKPVFVIEEASGNVNSLQMNRVEIARELSGVLERTPEQITWLELSSDKSLSQIAFEYTHTDRIVSYAGEMSMEDREAGIQNGELVPEDVDRYNIHEQPASMRDFQAYLGDALEPYEVRQNEEFRKMELPPVVMDIGEIRELPSQHDFENEPDLSF